MKPRYTEEECELLKSDKTDEELAEILHRSIKGIKQQRYRVCGKNKRYERFSQLDNTATTWNKENIKRFSDSLSIGQTVTVRVKYYSTSESDKTHEEKAKILKKYPDVCMTDKGTFQYKELLRWKIGGDFIV